MKSFTLHGQEFSDDGDTITWHSENGDVDISELVAALSIENIFAEVETEDGPDEDDIYRESREDY